MANRQQRTVLWRHLEGRSLEYCTLLGTEYGLHLDGRVILSLDGRPYHLRYQVAADLAWVTRAVNLIVNSGQESQRLQLTVDENGRWWHGEWSRPELDGCLDVDLAFTPATNTLPIRRLKLPAGESQTIKAAWVRFPGLAFEPLVQKYTRLSDAGYRYESDGFNATLEIDDMGLVRSYSGGWERLAAHDG